MSRLPPKPDFSAIEAAAVKGGGRRTVTLTLIGNLVHCWSNDESLFIYILMLLMETDEASSAIVFATLNTTRAHRSHRTSCQDQATSRSKRSSTISSGSMRLPAPETSSIIACT